MPRPLTALSKRPDTRGDCFPSFVLCIRWMRIRSTSSIAQIGMGRSDHTTLRKTADIHSHTRPGNRPHNNIPMGNRPRRDSSSCLLSSRRQLRRPPSPSRVSNRGEPKDHHASLRGNQRRRRGNSHHGSQPHRHDNNHHGSQLRRHGSHISEPSAISPRKSGMCLPIDAACVMGELRES